MKYYYVGTLPHHNDLAHYGVKGMRWGIRRYQNEDGSLTEAGKKKVRKYKERELRVLDKRNKRLSSRYQKKEARAQDKYDENPTEKNKEKLFTAKNRRIYNEKTFKAEAAKVRGMKLSDITAEQKAIGKAYVKAFATSLGVNAAFRVTGIPLIYARIPNEAGIKSKNRISSERAFELANEALSATSREVNGSKRKRR